MPDKVSVRLAFIEAEALAAVARERHLFDCEVQEHQRKIEERRRQMAERANRIVAAIAESRGLPPPTGKWSATQEHGAMVSVEWSPEVEPPPNVVPLNRIAAAVGANGDEVA